MTVLAEETAIREVWEETGVRAGNCVKHCVAYILLIPVICWNGSSQAIAPNVGFSSRFRNSVHMMTNISWLQFAAQLFKLLKSIKFEANPWNGFTRSTCQILRLCIHITCTCMYPAWKCKTQSISLWNKQWSTFPDGRKIHLSHDHDIPHHVINFFWIHEGNQSISWYMQLPF